MSNRSPYAPEERGPRRTCPMGEVERELVPPAGIEPATSTLGKEYRTSKHPMRPSGRHLGGSSEGERGSGAADSAGFCWLSRSSWGFAGLELLERTR